MSLPTLRVFIGLYADLQIIGVGSPQFDFTLFAETRVVCTALGITKQSSVGAQLEILPGGEDLLLHLVPADTTGKTPGVYPWQIQVRTASPADAWRDVADVGDLDLASPG